MSWVSCVTARVTRWDWHGTATCATGKLLRRRAGRLSCVALKCCQEPMNLPRLLRAHTMRCCQAAAGHAGLAARRAQIARPAAAAAGSWRGGGRRTRCWCLPCRCARCMCGAVLCMHGVADARARSQRAAAAVCPAAQVARTLRLLTRTTGAATLLAALPACINSGRSCRWTR